MPIGRAGKIAELVARDTGSRLVFAHNARDLS